MRWAVTFAVAFALVAAVPSPRPARAAETVKVDEPTRQAVEKALAWLKAEQRRDGSWGPHHPTAMTAFAILAFLANGHVPNQGLYGPEVARGVRYLLAAAREDGYLAGREGGNMYGHGMAALALSQVYGMTGDDEVKKVLKRATDLIVKTQNHEGGWRYNPTPSDADISATIMQVMALRGAKDGGLHVPNETLKRAVAYIQRCRDPRSGGYRYQPHSSGPGYARTAAGVCVLQLSGEYEAKEIAQAVAFLERTGDDGGHYWYGHYYAAHAFHQVGGKHWEDYYKRMRTKLLATQKPSGEWSDHHERNVGSVYQTAIAVLILSVPANYLPIYQA